MPITIDLTIPVEEVKRGDLLEATEEISKVRTLSANIELQFVDYDRPKRIRIGTLVDVTRQVNTWQDEMDKAQDGLAHGVEEVVKIVNEAMESKVRKTWLDKLNETSSTNDLLYRLGWDTESMMIDLQVEAKLQLLGNMFGQERFADTPKHEVILMFLERMREALVDWTPNRSTSVSSNMVADAEHLALRKFVKDGLGFGHGFSTVQFYVRYAERLAAVAPEDLNTPFDRDAFKLMED